MDIAELLLILRFDECAMIMEEVGFGGLVDSLQELPMTSLHVRLDLRHLNTLLTHLL